MTKLQEYLYTDWAAMTGTDWFGLILTIVIFILMVVVYFWVLNPKNKKEIESHRFMILNDDDIKSEK